MMIKDELSKKILDTILSCFGAKLRSVILYGSYAENREAVYSDIDLLIILDSKFSDWREKRQIEVLLRKETSSIASLSPKIMTEKEFLSALENYNPLILNAVSSGKTLYDSGIFKTASKQFDNVLGSKITKTKEGYWQIAL